MLASFDGYFVQLNPAWETTLGYTEAELMARPFIEFVHPDDVEATLAEVAKLERGVTTISFENRYRHQDGTWRWLCWSSTPLPERGLIMAAASDVTDRHRAEEELRSSQEELRTAMEAADRASQAKSEFLSRMSHELRTPMNSVLGFAQLLAMDDLTEDQRENVGYIQRAGHHLLGLINDVLDVARIEAGRLSLSLEPVDVGEVLSSALDLVRVQAAERDLSLRVNLDDAETCVLADRHRLLQVILNLLSNAVKYNRPGGRITVGCEHSGGTVAIAVADTGLGISEEDQRRLFVPFERLGAEATDIEGTGVGLVLSRALCQEMGGALTLSSEIGVGTTFVLEFPQATFQEVSGTVPTTEAHERSQGVTRTVRVVCVEDNPANAQLIERAVHGRNVQLVTAIQGRLGLELIQGQQPDLVLLDLHLPDMRGEEVLRHVRSDPVVSGVPVAICSADASPGQAKRLIGQGADAYLTKPLDLGELIELIEKVRAGKAIGPASSLEVAR